MTIQAGRPQGAPLRHVDPVGATLVVALVSPRCARRSGSAARIQPVSSVAEKHPLVWRRLSGGWRRWRSADWARAGEPAVGGAMGVFANDVMMQ